MVWLIISIRLDIVWNSVLVVDAYIGVKIRSYWPWSSTHTSSETRPTVGRSTNLSELARLSQAILRGFLFCLCCAWFFCLLFSLIPSLINTHVNIICSMRLREKRIVYVENHNVEIKIDLSFEYLVCIIHN